MVLKNHNTSISWEPGKQMRGVEHSGGKHKIQTHTITMVSRRMNKYTIHDVCLVCLNKDMNNAYHRNQVSNCCGICLMKSWIMFPP